MLSNIRFNESILSLSIELAIKVSLTLFILDISSFDIPSKKSSGSCNCSSFLSFLFFLQEFETLDTNLLRYCFNLAVSSSASHKMFFYLWI